MSWLHLHRDRSIPQLTIVRGIKLCSGREHRFNIARRHRTCDIASSSGEDMFKTAVVQIPLTKGKLTTLFLEVCCFGQACSLRPRRLEQLCPTDKPHWSPHPPLAFQLP